MKLIKPSFEILKQSEGLEGIFKQIEIAGRTCYKSEDKITEDSAQEFVERMIKLGHRAMLEQGTVYLSHPIENIAKPDYQGIGNKYRENKYSKVVSDNWGTKYITTNYRVLVENGWLDDLKYICEPTEFHAKRTTVKFICDIGISREFNRHRANSPAEQSTRYCNYTKNKFNNEISIIQPEEILTSEISECKNSWVPRIEDKTLREDTLFKAMCDSICNNTGQQFGIIDTWMFANLASQWSYNQLINLGWTAQQARRVLPLDLQTELIHTAFDSDWRHFFDLRTPQSAHPQARELAIPLEEEFIKLGKI